MPGPSSSFRAVLVRPYDARIRERVQRLLASVGWVVDTERVIPVGTPDEDVVQTVIGFRSTLLVVPFHAHRDFHGRPVDGLGVIQRLAEARRDFPWAVVTPISRVAVAAALLRMQRGLSPTIRDRVLPVYEDELDASGTRERLGCLAVESDPMKPFSDWHRRASG